MIITIENYPKNKKEAKLLAEIRLEELLILLNKNKNLNKIELIEYQALTANSIEDWLYWVFWKDYAPLVGEYGAYKKYEDLPD